MAQEQDSEPFEWVNRWAENAARAPATLAVTQPIAPVVPDDLLARDIAEIVLRRDALDLVPIGFDFTAGRFAARRQRQALTLVAARTTDAVPLMVGGVLAVVMLSVFGAAAVMSKFAR
jgi:hypothetical protein